MYMAGPAQHLLSWQACLLPLRRPLLLPLVAGDPIDAGECRVEAQAGLPQGFDLPAGWGAPNHIWHARQAASRTEHLHALARD